MKIANPPASSGLRGGLANTGATKLDPQVYIFLRVYVLYATMY